MYIISEKKLLVVCLGNICRSPAGEYLLQHYSHQSKKYKIQNMQIESAGINPVGGSMSYHSKECFYAPDAWPNYAPAVYSRAGYITAKD